jgi:hypothetical protein
VILWELWTGLDPGYMYKSYAEYISAVLGKKYRPELFPSIPQQWRELIASVPSNSGYCFALAP